MFCKQCGRQIPDQAVICVHCGVPASGVGVNPKSRTRIAYILLGIFLGGLGIHNFYAGYNGKAVAQLLITLLTGWLIVPLIVVWIWVIVELVTVTKDAQGYTLT